LAQLFTSLLTFVSQPLFGLPSQLLKPAAQVGTHTPALQVVLPLALEQVTPHAPQFAVVFSAVSQPFLALPSQLPKPALHTGTQTPAAQDVVPFELVQASPQPLQCATVLCVSVSQPLFGRLSQSPQPAVQAGVQVPLGQLVVPWAFVQLVPHAPQFVVVFRDASQPFEAALLSQLPKPAVHAIPQLPEAQLGVPLLLLQTVPHAPQFELLVWVLASQPSAVTPLQLPYPALQAPREQVPEPQDSAAFAKSQTAPQAPQLVSEVSAVSHPFAALPSQLAKPALQAPS
jgi:hypothetical protein